MRYGLSSNAKSASKSYRLKCKALFYCLCFSASACNRIQLVIFWTHLPGGKSLMNSFFFPCSKILLVMRVRSNSHALLAIFSFKKLIFILTFVSRYFFLFKYMLISFILLSPFRPTKSASPSLKSHVTLEKLLLRS